MFSSLFFWGGGFTNNSILYAIIPKDQYKSRGIKDYLKNIDFDHIYGLLGFLVILRVLGRGSIAYKRTSHSSHIKT